MFYTFSVPELLAMYEYDPCTGQIMGLSTGRYVGTMHKRSYVVPTRKSGAVHNLPAGKLAWLLHTGTIPKTRVYFLDGDVSNLCWDNLTLDVVTKSDRGAFIKTEHPNIFIRKSDQSYVVRRGPKEAVFRTLSLNEAISEQKRYLSSISSGITPFCGRKTKKLDVID